MKNSDKIFDGLLVLEFLSGNKKAMSLLAKRWHAIFSKHAYRYVKDRDMAQDIAQESWSVIMRKIHMLKDVNSFGSWGLTIVTRQALDVLRKKKKELQELETFYDQNQTKDKEDFDQTAIVNLLKKEIKNLSKDHQAVLQLFYIDGFSIKQISEILQVSIGTIKSRLFHSREKLKQIFKNHT